VCSLLSLDYEALLLTFYCIAALGVIALVRYVIKRLRECSCQVKQLIEQSVLPSSGSEARIADPVALDASELWDISHYLEDQAIEMEASGEAMPFLRRSVVCVGESAFELERSLRVAR